VKIRTTIALLLCLQDRVTAQAPAKPSPPDTPATKQSDSKTTTCDGHFSGKSCDVVIDRTDPASPNKIVVPSRTKVTIWLKNARINEAVAFTPKTTQTPPPNVAETFLKAAIEPAKSTLFHVNGVTPPPPPPLPTHDVPDKDPITTSLDTAEDELAAALRSLNDARTFLSCLQAYRSTLGESGARYCDSQTLLNDDSFGDAKTRAIAAMNAAGAAALPFAILQDTAERIKTAIANASKIAGDKERLDKLRIADQQLSRQTVITTAIDDAQKAQSALRTTVARLRAMPSLAQDPSFAMTEANNYNSSIDISAQETIGGEKTSLATVSIVWQSSPWAVSTGIMFSGLENRTYANVAMFENGAPKVNEAGKTLTSVQETIKRPAVVFPIVMLHYKVPGASWLMASGGIGLNLATTTAEFVVGPSAKVFGLTFSPLAHFGRETSLAAGLKPGDQLGVDPPAPPTDTYWTKKPKFGVAISYALPFS
jgi:hypothetical protein